jgi:hypothetical protein
MHRTLSGAVITSGIVLSVLSALQGLRALTSDGSILRALSLGTVVICGVLAVRALVSSAAQVQAYVAAWAASLLLHIVLADVTVGYLRPGLTGRLLVTAFVAAILVAIVLGVPQQRMPAPSRQRNPA